MFDVNKLEWKNVTVIHTHKFEGRNILTACTGALSRQRYITGFYMYRCSNIRIKILFENWMQPKNSFRDRSFMNKTTANPLSVNEVTENVCSRFAAPHRRGILERWRRDCFYTRSNMFQVTGDAYVDRALPEPDSQLSGRVLHLQRSEFNFLFINTQPLAYPHWFPSLRSTLRCKN